MTDERGPRGAGVSIRSARPEDLSDIVAIYEDAVADGVSNCDLTGLPADQQAVWLANHDGRFPLFVAELDGQVAGWACLSVFVARTCFDRTAYTSTYVSKQLRRRGVGRRLREHVIEQARALGFHSLVNRIFTNNLASLHLTETLGFMRIGVLREVIWKDGEYWDAALYEFVLE